MAHKRWPFREKAGIALKDDVFQKGLASIQERIGKATLERYGEVPGIQELRQRARAIRIAAVDNLRGLLGEFEAQVLKGGGRFFFAHGPEEAREYVVQVARSHGVSTIVKGKSMVGEEIGINRALLAHGITPVETDLGEFIIQLAGEGPSHILGPAIHKSKEQIGRLFSERLGVPYTAVPEELTMIARKALRERFLAAEMGITGCNLAISSMGKVMLVSNEGNVRFSCTIPRVHLVLMGMERIVYDLEEGILLLRLLSRAAAAQRMATYVSLVGPEEKLERGGAFYVVVVDNGRSRIAQDPIFKEALACIRCGACLNICPVYGKVGGYAYGDVYSGPIGAVLNPLLYGVERFRDLFFGETQCGACKEICPLHIDLPGMQLELRRRYQEGDEALGVLPKKGVEYLLMASLCQVAGRPKLYRLARRLRGLIP